MTKKRYLVNVYIQTDIDMIVTAKNAREARALAHRRIAGRKIQHKHIRKEWTESEVEP